MGSQGEYTFLLSISHGRVTKTTLWAIKHTLSNFKEYKTYKVCPTLLASMGSYPESIPLILDDYGIRKITPYECLALQGFPKEYRFPKIPMASAYKQCGNSVVVPVIRRIAEQIIKVI